MLFTSMSAEVFAVHMEVLQKDALSLLCCQHVKSHPVVHRRNSGCSSSLPLKHHQAEQRCCIDGDGQCNQ